MAWAEDCAGRATVCLTRSMSYTSLISPLEMRGLFGMAQVIGAKTLGVVLVTEKYSRWAAPESIKGDRHHMDRWAINGAPHWTDIPLAIVYQTKALDDSSESRKTEIFTSSCLTSRTPLEISHDTSARLPLLCCQIPGKHFDCRLRPSFCCSSSNNGRMCQANCIDMQYYGGMRLTNNKDRRSLFSPHMNPSLCCEPKTGGSLKSVYTTHPPMRPLPGIYFFDAWRLQPQMTDLAPSSNAFDRTST